MSSTSSTTVASINTPSLKDQTTVVPWLLSAPRLIHNLGWCMAIASTREVAGIGLTTEGLEYR